MASGDHSLYDDAPGSLPRLRALLLKYPAIGARIGRKRRILRTFTIPYLAGISEDGLYVYVDKDLPAEVSGIPLDKFLEVHEAIEEAIWHEAQLQAKAEAGLREYRKYEPCHHLATAAEQYAVVSAGYDWQTYRGALHPEYAPIEHERITRVPRDLALYPYGGKLLAHMERVRAKSQFTQAEVRYREEGRDTRACASCGMFLPRTGLCTWVKGKIAPEYVCDKWDSGGGS
jgi:hypothetical protein